MSDTHERSTLPRNIEQEHPYAGLEQFWNFEVERRKLRGRSYAKVSVGLLGLFANLLLALYLIGFFGIDNLSITFSLVAVLTSVSSVWLVGQGLGGLENTRPLPPPHRQRSFRASRHRTEGSEKNTERQLLEVIERNGETTPARAALQTSLTVDEAEQMLSELAQRGHLDVRVEGSKLVYSL